MVALNESERLDARDAAARQHKLRVIQVAVALLGLSWLVSWLILESGGNGNPELSYFVWLFVLAEAVFAAGWYGAGYYFTDSKPVAVRIAKLAAIGHGAWFALGLGLVIVSAPAVGIAMSAGHFELGSSFLRVAAAVLFVGPFVAFALSLWIAGAIARQLKPVGPTIIGRSPGGSRLLKYGEGSHQKTAHGFPDEVTDPLRENRERVYEELFGPIESVHHEMTPLIPHVDVYVIAPRPDRDFYTLVTGGMSDLPMNSPSELGADVRRVELVWYVNEEKSEYVKLLRTLAHFPHDHKTWLHYGHTMPNGTPPAPIDGSSVLDTLFFSPSIIIKDASLPERLRWHDEPINLLWVVPITTAECTLKLEQGSDALFDLFERVQHPPVFTGDRRSYV